MDATLIGCLRYRNEVDSGHPESLKEMGACQTALASRVGHAIHDAFCAPRAPSDFEVIVLTGQEFHHQTLLPAGAFVASSICWWWSRIHGDPMCDVPLPGES